MRGIILFLAAIVLGLWSLFCWAVYGLLGFAGSLAEANIDLLPFPTEILYWTVDLLGGMGGAAVWIVWGLGAAAIVVVTLIPLALLPRRDRLRPPPGDPRYDFEPEPSVREPLAADQRSADEVVARVLGRTPRR